MRLLLDSHALIWFTVGSTQISRTAREAIREAEKRYVSAASAWEITTKHRLGKLEIAAHLAQDFATRIREEGFDPLPVTVAQAALAGRMDGAHKDPFARMLIAQALLDNLTLVSNESRFDAFGVSRLW